MKNTDGPELEVQIYGFGSYFKNIQSSQGDIDILLLHESPSTESSLAAIRCKRVLQKRNPFFHVTMLSKLEEEEINFLQRSRAIKLGNISWSRIERDLDRILGSLIESAPEVIQGD